MSRDKSPDETAKEVYSASERDARRVMGGSKSKFFPISYEDACRRGTSDRPLVAIGSLEPHFTACMLVHTLTHTYSASGDVGSAT